jgi:hypothetical protein
MIKLVTFKTNQTLIGDVEETATNVSIKMPAQVIIQPTQQGPTLAFVPFLEFSQEWKTGVSVFRSDVLSINTPVDQLINEYNKIFGSGIQIASTIPKL